MAALQVRRLQGGRALSRALASAALWCALGAGLAPSAASAHGLAPRALAPLLQDEQGVSLLRLTRGLARRGDDGFHYFCPAHGGGVESEPAAAFASGPALLALPGGLFLLAADGSSTPYPEPDLGSIVALAGSTSGLYALALRSERYELRRLERERSQLVWSAAQSAGDWLALDAGARSLLLLGLDGSLLTQLELSSSGAALSRAQADVGPGALSVEAHVVSSFARSGSAGFDGDTSYAIVRWESGDRIELGRIADGRWLSLAQAVGNLSGPVETYDGKRLIARDGALVSFDDERVGAHDDGEFVTALASSDDKLYASVRDGLRELSGAVLGALVFDFATLHGPLSDGLTPPEQTACQSAWQHLQVDLVAAGLIGVDTALDAGIASSLDAASATAPADAVAPGASGAGRGPSERSDAADSRAAAGARHAGGCALLHGAVPADPALALAGLALLFALGRRQRTACRASELRARGATRGPRARAHNDGKATNCC